MPIEQPKLEVITNLQIKRSPSVENEIDEGDPQNETFRDGMD